MAVPRCKPWRTHADLPGDDQAGRLLSDGWLSPEEVLAPSQKLSLEGAPDVLARVLSPLADLPRAPAHAISQALGPQPAIVRGAAEPLLGTAPAHPGPVDDLF